jgi:hypothetical protein
MQQFYLSPPLPVYFSISYNLINPSYNLFETIASVTPNLADGEISAVPSLSIFECSPPTPLAYNPSDLATSFNLFSSVPPFVIFGNFPNIDYLFPVPIFVGHVVIIPYVGCSANFKPLFSIPVKRSCNDLSTKPRSFP